MSTSAFSQNSIYGDYSHYKNLDTITKVLKEQFPLDLDKDGKMDTIRIENVKDFEGDPEDFSEITVKFGNGNLLTLKNVNGYFRDTSITISVPVLYRGTRITVLDGPNNCASIILNGYQYPSCHNHLLIASISQNRSFTVRDFALTVTKIYSEPNTEIVEIIGIDHCTDELKSFNHRPDTK
ncbi:MAG: hypothetical protein ACYC1Q_00480 [Bacteroidia bacterium]